MSAPTADGGSRDGAHSDPDRVSDRGECSQSDRSADAAHSTGAHDAALYAALLGERLPTETLVRQWLNGPDASTLVLGVLECLPQPGGLESLQRMDDERHGPDGPVRAEWPPLLRVTGTVRYVAMVALALHEHGVWRSSRPARELDPIAEAMMPLVAHAWQGPLLAVRARAQVV